jgi:signal transduction histidine kinase
MSHLNGSVDSGSASAISALHADHFASIAQQLPAPDMPDERAREIAVITHELRNSLCVVRNAARLLALPLAAGTVDTARVLIERHVVQMGLHLQGLLDTSRPGVNPLGLRLEQVDLRTIAGFAVDDIASDLVRRGHHLTVNLPPEAVFVQADPAKLEQALSNLLINAAKYTPSGGEVSLTIDVEGEQACVRIRDSGIGIAPATITHIFDLFMQANPAAPQSEGGRGIGLAIARGVVEMHGGTIRAASEGLGLGSEFVVRLPALPVFVRAPTGPGVLR